MKPCPVCNTKTKYNTEYDCFYCEVCNIWTESTCPDAYDCEFCAKRPETPIEEKQ